MRTRSEGLAIEWSHESAWGRPERSCIGGIGVMPPDASPGVRRLDIPADGAIVPSARPFAAARIAPDGAAFGLVEGFY